MRGRQKCDAPTDPEPPGPCGLAAAADDYLSGGSAWTGGDRPDGFAVEPCGRRKLSLTWNGHGHRGGAGAGSIAGGVVRVDPQRRGQCDRAGHGPRPR